MMRLRSLVAALAVTAFALSVVGVRTTPAVAHDQLLASNPSEGAVLSAAPQEVRLDFSDAVLDLGGLVIVADASGTNWADGDLSLSLNHVTQKLAPGAPDGAYQIRWRVVSADGHPISDVVNYSVGEEAAPPIATAPSSGAQPATPSAADAPDVQTGAASPGLLFAGLGLGGAVLGTGAYLLITLLIRRRETA